MNNPQPCILFFSRGKGRGHAIPDCEIAARIIAKVPTTRIQFVSYSTGAQTLRARGWSVIDLQLPEDATASDLSAFAFELIRRKRPTMVISHEEFCLPAAASVYGVPSALLTDWFPPQYSLAHYGMAYADRVIVLDTEDIHHNVPEEVSEKVTFVGPVLQCDRVSPNDRRAMRRRLGLSEDAVVVMVMPGSAFQHSEKRAPICDLVSNAFQLLSPPRKRLLWIAREQDYEVVHAKLSERHDVSVWRPLIHALPVMSVANVIVTTGNRITVLESEALNIPSISLSYGNNPVDDVRIAAISSNTALQAERADPENVAKAISAALDKGVLPTEYPSPAIRNSADRAVEGLLDLLSGCRVNDAARGESTKPVGTPRLQLLATLNCYTTQPSDNEATTSSPWADR